MQKLIIDKILDDPKIHIDAFIALVEGRVSCIICKRFLPEGHAEAITRDLLDSEFFVDHADVPGLKVLGLSHFQAVRDISLFSFYSNFGSLIEEKFREICAPIASPFDLFLSYMTEVWVFGIRKMTLKGEPPFAPFTIRSCGKGIGIEPHQDILSAESPEVEKAAQLQLQLASNIFLSTSSRGGDLLLFNLVQNDTGYTDLNGGPMTIPIEKLPKPSITISPEIGDLIIFDCTKVHMVTNNEEGKHRITVSSFMALQNMESEILYWA